MFFDRRDLIDVGFNDLDVGDSVAFELIDDQFSGPRAVLVRRVDGKKRIRSDRCDFATHASDSPERRVGL